jgi:hypothetical protein
MTAVLGLVTVLRDRWPQMPRKSSNRHVSDMMRSVIGRQFSLARANKHTPLPNRIPRGARFPLDNPRAVLQSAPAT